MPYKTNTHPLHERKALIKQAVESSKEQYPFFEYQNKRVDLPIVRLDITVPVYRMANYRTITSQLKYVQDHKKPSDFFSNGQENESAQQAQHDILVNFAKQGRAASVSPIYDELQTEEQRDPLIITTGGVVVNGNRRLAAMRELLIEAPAEYRNFSHVDCAVLPENVTADEVREIEVRLQMRPETKLPYGWVNESLAIRDLFQSGRKAQQISDLMKKKKKDVERAARALTEAELYLKEWLRQPGEYQHVEDAEQFFNDLAKALDGKTGDALEISRRVAWVLISNSKNLKRRVYDYNFSFDRRTDEVVSALADRLGVDLIAPAPEEAGGDDNDDDVDVDVDIGDEGATSLDPLIDAFDDEGQRQTITDELIAVCDTIIEQDREGEIGRSALTSAQTANTKLHEMDLTRADPSTYTAIDTQLDSVIQRANRLKASLQNYMKPKNA